MRGARRVHLGAPASRIRRWWKRALTWRGGTLRNLDGTVRRGRRLHAQRRGLVGRGFGRDGLGHDVGRERVVGAEDDLLRELVLIEPRTDRRDRDVGGLALRIAEHAGRDARERDRLDRVLACDLEAAPVARRELRAHAGATAAVDRPDGVDDVLRRQLVALRELRLAGLATAERAALDEQLAPGAPVDRAVDAATAEEAGVRGVDDRV